MTTTDIQATDRQVAYICALCGVGYLSQVNRADEAKAAGVEITKSQLRRGLTRFEASRIIDRLEKASA